MEPSYQAMFKRWSADINSAPIDGSIFMGRITGSNRAVAVKFGAAGFIMAQPPYDSVNICQWISFTDFADIRSCVWRNF